MCARACVHVCMCPCACMRARVCVHTCMRAAARGSEELMRTGWEISILCLLLLSWAARWLMDRAVNECRFLAFFFPSPRLWHPLFPLDGEGPGEGPGEQGPNGAGAGAGAGEGAELGPGTGATTDLSISISCLAVSFNWKQSGERDEDVRGREGESMRTPPLHWIFKTRSGNHRYYHYLNNGTIRTMVHRSILVFGQHSFIFKTQITF